MQCFDKGVTWDAIGEAVKAHRFASDAESHNVIRDMLHMLDDRYRNTVNNGGVDVASATVSVAYDGVLLLLTQLSELY